MRLVECPAERAAAVAAGAEADQLLGIADIGPLPRRGEEKRGGRYRSEITFR